MTDRVGFAVTEPNRVVLKLGGNAIDSPVAIESFAAAAVELHRRGVEVTVLHGGGPQIDQQLMLAGIESSRVAGMRVTTPEAMVVIHDVMVNDVQKKLVEAIDVEAERRSPGVPGACAISPIEERIFACIQWKNDDSTIDLQRVGRVEGVDDTAVRAALMRNEIPVVTGIGVGVGDSNAISYNINADSAAAALAGSMAADDVVFVSNVPGLYRDFEHRRGLVERLTVREAGEVLETVADGMIPKLQACIDAVDAGATRARMVSIDDIAHLDAILSGRRTRGTMVTADER